MTCDIKGRVPTEAEADYFQDHFPKFPVLPGVLALEILRRAAEDFLGGRWRISRLSRVRFSGYLRPGDEWEAQLHPVKENEREGWKGVLTTNGRTAVQAQFFLEPTA